MPALKYSKIGKKTYVYIIENKTVIDSETGKKKTKRVQLESLGVLNKDVSKSQAKMTLSQYMDTTQPLTSDLTLKCLIDEFEIYYKNQIEKTIRKSTYFIFVHKSKHLKSIEHLKIKHIDYVDIEKLKESLIASLSNRSINIALINLRKILNYAKKRNYISKIPIIENLKEYSKEITRLSKDQLQEIIRISEGATRFYIYVMAFTGLRPNEFFNLNWDDVQLEKGMITIRSNNRLKRGRKIAIHDNLLTILTKEYKSSGRVCPYTNVSSAHNAVLRAGRKIGVKISPYSLRKTFFKVQRPSESVSYKPNRL